MKKLIPFIFLFLLIPQSLWAACGSWSGAGTSGSPYTATAASIAQTDVAACISAVSTSQSGYVVINIPSGTDTTTWTSAVSVDMSSAPFANVTHFTLQGAGVGVTNISDNGTNTTFNVARLFQLKSNSGMALRLTGMTLSYSLLNASCASTSGLIYVNGSGTQTRIDTITFNLLSSATMTGETGISIHQDTGAYGVTDNCIFNTTESHWSGNGIKVFGAAGGNGYSTAWVRGFSPGTVNAWYIENNTFNFLYRGNDAVDSYVGGRYVMRYNTLHGSSGGGHGNDSGGSGDGVFSQEVYNNAYDNYCAGGVGGYCYGTGSNSLSWVFMWRGGTGVFFNNAIDTHHINSVSVAQNYRGEPYASGVSTNSDNSSTVLLTTTTTGANVNNYLYNQEDHSYCQITGISAGVSITCSGGLTGGTNNYWSSGNHFDVLYFRNTDGGCDGYAISAVGDGNVSGQHGWLCREQIGSTYINGNTYCTANLAPFACCTGSGTGTCPTGLYYMPIYAWGNVYSSTAGWVVANPGNIDPDKTYQTVANQTFFNCTSAANCQSATNAVNVPGYGTNQGWLYPGAYTCPHPLVGTGACGSGAGIAAYTLGSPTYYVTLSHTGAGGSINYADGAYPVTNPGTITFTATVNNGWIVTWSGTGGCTGTGTTCTVTNPASDKTAIATFTPIPILPWH